MLWSLRCLAGTSTTTYAQSSAKTTSSNGKQKVAAQTFKVCRRAFYCVAMVLSCGRGSVGACDVSHHQWSPTPQVTVGRNKDGSLKKKNLTLGFTAGSVV